MGIGADPTQDRCRRFLVAAESAREHLQRLILGAAEILNEMPEPDPLQSLRGLSRSLRACGDSDNPATWRTSAAATARDLSQLVLTQLHCDPAGDPGLSVDRFIAWAKRGGSAPARLCQKLAGQSPLAAANLEVSALPELDPATLGERLLGTEGEAFAALPTWDGQVFETTAFTRQRQMPLIAGLEARFGDSILTRLAARQVEIFALAVQLSALAAIGGEVDGPTIACRGGDAAEGIGVAQVETARGRLIHAVRLAGGRVADYRILAPTEWNFHPEGPAAARLSCLAQSHSRPDDELKFQARLLIEAFDPCVDYRLTVQ